MAQLSNTAVYASMLVYALALFAFAASLAARRVPLPSSQKVLVGPAGATATEQQSHDEPGRKSGNIAISLTWLATGLLIVGFVLRGLAAERFPLGNMYEFSLGAAIAVALVYLIAASRTDLRWLGVWVVGAVLLTLGVAVTLLYTESAQLVPALKSWWLVIHVSAAAVSGGAFTLSAGLIVAYLIKQRAEDRGTAGKGLASRLPSAERLDGLAYRTIAFVFPVWTFAVIAGAIWAENAWGRYWGWDPKETWAFITWVIYAGYLHARSTAGWKGRKAAVIGLIGFLAFLINYFGVNLFATGLHSYSGV
ncbi:MAG: c-type cytochrome biogenesis protein CcsB [Actinobacteria bacterium]|nr:c-type cytochrome biogenesis protein CcsB [Actinomycetota bacterium]MCB8998160.1 c-type cytochrome biogenesis protein CcsB [Actinomycetota bacterium]MCB9415248.1 c-type cytochrome biogenesis protein CcsB [Actinomycetota bacterium]